MNRFRMVEATLKSEFEKPYVSGKSDCFFLVLAMIDTLTGSALSEKYKGHYRTVAGSQKALKKLGFNTLTEFFASELGQEPVGPASARLGDIVILNPAEGIIAPAICLGTRFCTKVEQGRKDVGMSDVAAAFHIGGP